MLQHFGGVTSVGKFFKGKHAVRCQGKGVSFSPSNSSLISLDLGAVCLGKRVPVQILMTLSSEVFSLKKLLVLNVSQFCQRIFRTVESRSSIK